MTQIDIELLSRHTDEFCPLARLANRFRISRENNRPGAPASECILDVRQELGNSEIAHHGENYIIRKEILFMKIEQIVALDPLDRFWISVRWTM